MSTDPGTLHIPESDHGPAPTAREDLDRAVETVGARAKDWAALEIPARLDLIDELLADTLAASDAWTVAAAAAKGIRSDSTLMGEDWLLGPVVVLRNLQLLRATLADILATGRPQPLSLGLRPDGQVTAEVFPTAPLDRLLFTGFSAEVRLQPHVTLDQATARMGRIYRDGGDDAGLALVLGAGNVSSIPLMDVLYKLFADNRVCVLKMNPVNAHLGPHLAEAFQALVREGYLRIVYGGGEVGAHLTGHDGVDEVHITGSDKTHDTIVFGPGEHGARRRRDDDPVLDKPISSELGNVSPVIVVPGPWSDADTAYHGDNIASMMVNNAGFNCVAARMIVQHRAWAGRTPLLHAVRDSLRRTEQREPYYPGAVERWERFTRAHPQAEWFGPAGDGKVPFTLIPELDPDDTDAVAYTTEAFCGVVGEVALDAPRSVPDYIDEAVDFCNERLWGTLAATIIVHPRSLRDPAVAAAVERAIDRLRYGSVVVNHWTGVAYGMVSTSWGAYPGHDRTDIQSGRGVVHNSYLLQDAEKSVVRGPFRTPLTPVWFHTHRTVDRLGPRLARLEATRDPRLLPGVIALAMRG